MRRQFLSLLCLVIVFGLCGVGSVRAEEILFLSPTRITLNDANKVAVVNVTNLSDIKRTYKVTTANIIMNPKGYTEEVNDFDYSAKRMIRFVPREFSIAPGQRQAVRIMARLPADTKEGDYHCHISFEEDVKKREKPEVVEGETLEEGKAGMAAPVAYSAMIPVIMSHGKIDVTVAMVDPKISKSTRGPNTYDLSMQISRKGNGQGLAVFQLTYTQPNGEVVELGKRSTAYIYREIDQRNYSHPFTLPEGVGGGGSLRISMYNNHSSTTPIQTADMQLPQ